MQTLLNQREAACALRCSERALERLRLTGNGPRYIKTTRRVPYREADLEAWGDREYFQALHRQIEKGGAEVAPLEFPSGASRQGSFSLDRRTFHFYFP